jgi:membrane protease YdiL (CAAX protease family)
VRLGLEFVLVFIVFVGVYTWLGHPGSPLIPLAVLAIIAVVYLRRQPGFDRRNLWRREALTPAVWRSILRLWALAVVVGVGAVWLFLPGQLFNLPRDRPWLWLAVMIFYPLVSVYPQEIVFRAFMAERYAPVFGRGAGIVAASALSFGYVHIIFGNWIAVVLSLIGGVLFFRRYVSTRSLLAASVEHALYGQLVFTIGLGAYFYHGTNLT